MTVGIIILFLVIGLILVMLPYQLEQVGHLKDDGSGYYESMGKTGLMALALLILFITAFALTDPGL